MVIKKITSHFGKSTKNHFKRKWNHFQLIYPKKSPQVQCLASCVFRQANGWHLLERRKKCDFMSSYRICWSLFLRADIKEKKKEVHPCCVFWPAFWCCAHPKAGQNTFFQPFSTFFVYLKPFSVISRLKSRKTVWKWTWSYIYLCNCQTCDVWK